MDVYKILKVFEAYTELDQEERRRTRRLGRGLRLFNLLSISVAMVMNKESKLAKLDLQFR